MKEIISVMYEASDGTRFSDKNTCIEHENKLKEYENLKRSLKRIKAICSDNMECEECPFYSDYDCMFRNFDCISDCIPVNWKIN